MEMQEWKEKTELLPILNVVQMSKKMDGREYTTRKVRQSLPTEEISGQDMMMNRVSQQNLTGFEQTDMEERWFGQSTCKKREHHHAMVMM